MSHPTPWEIFPAAGWLAAYAPLLHSAINKTQKNDPDYDPAVPASDIALQQPIAPAHFTSLGTDMLPS